jgi:hypothetical protein
LVRSPEKDKRQQQQQQQPNSIKQQQQPPPNLNKLQLLELHHHAVLSSVMPAPQEPSAA